MANDTRYVVLTNMLNANVSVRKPQYGVNRTWTRFGQPMRIPFDTVEQLLWDTGFSNMIRSGILYIENMQDKIDLGLEPEGAKEPENIIVLSEKQMNDLWNNKPIEVFKAEVRKLPQTQIDNLIEYAIKNKCVNVDKCTFIKVTYNRDILRSISLNEDVSIADAKEAEKKKQRQLEDEGRR